MEKISGLVRQHQASNQDLTEEGGVAIVQHYSDELKIGAWLIDFT